MFATGAGVLRKGELRNRIQPFRVLITAGALFTAVYVFATIFVNIYVFGLRRDLGMVGIFNLYLSIAWAGTYIIGSWQAHRSLRFSGLMGGLMLAVGLLILLIAQNRIVDFYGLVGISIGAAGGFFYVSYNLYFAELTREGSRAEGFAKAGFLQSIVSMMVPALSGFLVAKAGYVAAFGLFLLTSLVLCLCMWLLPDIPIKERATWKGSIEIIRKRAYLGMSEVMVAVYWTFLALSGGLFLYAYGSSVEGTGMWATVGSVVSIIIFIGLTKVKSAHLKKKFFTFSALLILGFTSLLLIDKLTAFIIFNLSMALLNPVYSNYSNERQFDVLDQLGIGRLHGLLVREVMINIGRIVLYGMLVIGLLEPGKITLGVIAVIGLLPLLAMYLLHLETKTVYEQDFPNQDNMKCY